MKASPIFELVILSCMAGLLIGVSGCRPDQVYIERGLTVDSRIPIPRGYAISAQKSYETNDTFRVELEFRRWDKCGR